MHAAGNSRPPTLERMCPELARLFLPRTRPGRVTDAPIEGLKLIQRTSSTDPMPVTYEPILAVVVQGCKQIELGGAVIIYHPTRFLLTSLDLSVLSRVTGASPQKPYVCLALRLGMPVARELVCRIETVAGETVSRGPAMAKSPVTVGLPDALRRPVALLDAQQDLPLLSGMVRREITCRILRSPAGARLRQISAPGEGSRRVGRAVDRIPRNFRKPPRVAGLAEMAAMAVSIFHRHFRALTNMSPHQYQRKLRLRAARHRMLIDGLDVASAAYKWGYECVSQFTHEYGWLFGRPPARWRLPEAREGEARPVRGAGPGGLQ